MPANPLRSAAEEGDAEYGGADFDLGIVYMGCLLIFIGLPLSIVGLLLSAFSIASELTGEFGLGQALIGLACGSVLLIIGSVLLVNGASQLSRNDVVTLPPAVEAGKAKLAPEMQSAFVRDFGLRRKSLLVAYITWLLLGWHYLYLGKIGLQFAFWFTGGGLLVWWLIDLFRMPGVVARRNEDVAREMMVQYKLMG
jgi:hypothetical protein